MATSTKLRQEIQHEVEQEMSSRFAAEQWKMTQDLSELRSQLRAADEERARLMEVCKNKERLLKDKEAEHKAEIERISRSDRKTSKQNRDEVAEMKRQLQSKEKELKQLAEKLSRTMADKDRLDDENKRMKQLESRLRRSTTPTSPSLSPSPSMEELSAAPKHITRRERDMIVKNSELSYRVRTLEELVATHKAESAELATQLKETRSQLAPMRGHTNKLNMRINELNATLRSRDKKLNSLSQEIVELKSSKQQLEEEFTNKRKSLQQEILKNNTLRNDVQKLNGRLTTMDDTNARLLAKVDRLETDNSSLEQRVRDFTLCSPSPLSPTPLSHDDETCSLNSSSSSVQLLEEQISQIEFDRDEADIKLQEITDKYQEMKAEYSDLRSKHKTQQKTLRELQISFKLELSKTEMLEMEKLRLEKDLNLLRRASPGFYDQDREEVTVDSLQLRVDQLQSEVDTLQEHIIEQDTIWTHQEEVWNEEKEELMTRIEELGSVEELVTDPIEYDSTQDDNEPAEDDLVTDQQDLLCSQDDLLAALDDPNGVQDETIPEDVGPAELEERNARLAEELLQESERVALLEQTNRELSDKMAGKSQELDHKVTSLETANAELVSQLGAQKKAGERMALLEQTNRELTDKLEGKSQELNHKVTSLETANEELVFQLGAQKKTLEILENTKERLEKDLSTASDKVSSLQEMNAQLRVSWEAEQTANTQLRNDVEQIQQILENKEEECSSLLDKLSQLEEQLEQQIPASADSSIASPLSTDDTETRHLTVLSQQFQEQLTHKEDENQELRNSLAHAHKNIAQMRVLLEDLQKTLHAQSEEHSAQLREKDHQVAHLTDQLSQASSKLTRQKRAVPVGVNNQMASELGHKLKNTLKQLSVEVQSSSSRSHLLPPLRSLERAVNELLHTLYPGSFDAYVTPVSSEVNLLPDTSLPSEHSSLSIHEDSFDTHTTPLTAPPTGDPSLSVRDKTPTKDVMSPEGSYHWQNSVSSGGRVNGVPEPRVFVAVMDYEPSSLCVTGNPDYELSFNTGAVLAVRGEMDADGYYSAEFNGRRGRVPANFVQEVEVSDPVTKNRLFDQTLGSPLPLDPYTVPSRYTLLTSPTETSLTPSYISSQLRTPSQGIDLPQPPASFRVEKALGNSVLLLTWQPPRMDVLGGSHSNGCLVTGYQLYVDGETKTLVSGASQTKATLAGLNLSQSLTLGVSTAAANGKSSKVISIHYHPAPANVTGTTTTPEPEQYRMFIALYDYDPVKSSPCEHPEFELSFSEGDLIKIYGREMDDGFMSGELNGQRGLVPASFISEARSTPNKRVSEWREASLSESVRTTRSTLQTGPKLPHTTTIMVAAFDYDPEKDSPNPNPSLELTFKKGDQITLYGKMHGDGYYSGQLAGKFGLVPSNFLTKPKPSTPDQPPNKSPGGKMGPDQPTSSAAPQAPNGTDSGTKVSKSKPGKSQSVDTAPGPRNSGKTVDSPAGTKKKRTGFRWPGSRNN